jgi:hypothetical protein
VVMLYFNAQIVEIVDFKKEYKLDNAETPASLDLGWKVIAHSTFCFTI